MLGLIMSVCVCVGWVGGGGGGGGQRKYVFNTVLFGVVASPTNGHGFESH